MGDLMNKKFRKWLIIGAVKNDNYEKKKIKD